MSIFFDRETAGKLAQARWDAGFPESLPPGQHAPRKLVDDIIQNGSVTMEVSVRLKDIEMPYNDLRAAIEAALVGPYLEFSDPNTTADDCTRPAEISSDSLRKALELDRVKFDMLSEIQDIRSLQKQATTQNALQYVADRTQALNKKIEKAGLSYDSPS